MRQLKEEEEERLREQERLREEEEKAFAAHKLAQSDPYDEDQDAYQEPKSDEDDNNDR